MFLVINIKNIQRGYVWGNQNPHRQGCAATTTASSCSGYPPQQIPIFIQEIRFYNLHKSCCGHRPPALRHFSDTWHMYTYIQLLELLKILTLLREQKKVVFVTLEGRSFSFRATAVH